MPITSPSRLPIYTWATKPSPVGEHGLHVYISDVGIGGGSVWYSDGLRWRAVGGKVTLLKRITATATSASGTEQIAEQTPIMPAGLIQTSDTIRTVLSVQKSGTGVATTTSLRLGTAGTIADTAVWALANPAAANRTFATVIELIRVDATTIRGSGLIAAGVYAQGGAFPADVTVANMDSSALYLTLGFLNGTETTACKTLSVELLT